MVSEDSRSLWSTFSDSFWNACHYYPPYQEIFDKFINLFIRWTEPHPVVTCCLVFLTILPFIFLIRSDESYVKISRLYNISRLSIMTFFHKILYVYHIFMPIGYLIKQPLPCAKVETLKIGFTRLTGLPSTKLASFCLTTMYFGSLASASRKKTSIFFGMFLILISIHFVVVGDLSVSQSFFTLSLSYVLHFYSQHATLGYLHIENIIFFASWLAIFFSNSKDLLPGNTNPNLDMLGRLISQMTLLIVDEYMLLRYHSSRYRLAKIGRPIDLEYETGAHTGGYFSVLSSEEEIVFQKNLRSDIIDSAVAISLYIIGLTIRHYFVGIIKPSRGGLL